MTNPETQSIIIKAEAGELYHLWTAVEQFPRFMRHIQSVTVTGPENSHWVMAGVDGQTLEWDVETTRTEHDRRIAWNSREGGDLKTSGQVTFAPLPHGETEVTITRRYVPQPGRENHAGDLFADQAALLVNDLRNFKAYAEGKPERIQ
jgi:uncharacterized membrane protein